MVAVRSVKAEQGLNGGGVQGVPSAGGGIQRGQGLPELSDVRTGVSWVQVTISGELAHDGQEGSSGDLRKQRAIVNHHPLLQR